MSDSTEALQKAFAAHMGVPWEAYVKRAELGVRVAGDQRWPRWYLRFQWRPAAFPFQASHAENYGTVAEDAYARDREHNARILAAIPHTDPVPAEDPLSLAVRLYGHDGMSARFLSPFAVETRGSIQGYVPVFDDDGLPVMIGGLMMCEIRSSIALKRAQHFADESQQACSEPVEASADSGDGDTFRLTWCAFGWRGVLALYRFTRLEIREKKRGIELMTQRRGRDPRSVRVGFYRRGAVTI